MKIFNPLHAKGRYWQHLKRAGLIAGLLIGSGAITLVHALVPTFLPEFTRLAVERIKAIVDES